MMSRITIHLKKKANQSTEVDRQHSYDRGAYILSVTRQTCPHREIHVRRRSISFFTDAGSTGLVTTCVGPALPNAIYSIENLGGRTPVDWFEQEDMQRRDEEES